MDEYTFIVLAKLKADRLRLERQQANGSSAPTEDLMLCQRTARDGPAGHRQHLRICRFHCTACEAGADHA